MTVTAIRVVVSFQQQELVLGPADSEGEESEVGVAASESEAFRDRSKSHDKDRWLSSEDSPDVIQKYGHQRQQPCVDRESDRD